ncbi:MAG: sugar transferase [Beijerinckiaceae bacterium]
MRYPSSLSRLRYRSDIVELAAGILAPVAALFIRDPDFLARIEGEALQSVLIYVTVAALTTVAACAYFRTAQILPRYLSRKDVLRIIKAALAAAAMTAAVTFSITRLDPIPRSIPILHFILLASALIGWRFVHGAIQRRDGRARAAPAEGGETLIIAGANDLAHLFLRMLGIMHAGRARVVAIVDDDPKMAGRSIAGIPVLGSLSQSDAIIHEFRTHGVFVDRLVVAYPDEARRERALRTLEVVCGRNQVKIEDLSARLQFHEAGAGGSGVADETVAAPPRLRYFRIRYVFEKIFAAVALILLCPLLAMVGALVWFDVGRPLLFWQERFGVRGLTILVHKFRTLKSPVDAQGKFVPEAERLSGIGYFLRRTRLDELPQLFDILRGHMSFIGPRPLLPADIPEDADLRHLVRPGLTGWAQVHGGNMVTNEEKNALDEWYIHHACLSLDMKILFSTVRFVLFGEARQDGAIAEAMRYRVQAVVASGAAPGSNVTVLGPRLRSHAKQAVQAREPRLDF